MGKAVLAYPLHWRVLIWNPRVGLTVVMSSPLICFTMVVLPALSRPLRGSGAERGVGSEASRGIGVSDLVTHTIRIRISRSFRLTLRMMLSRPIAQRSISKIAIAAAFRL